MRLGDLKAVVCDSLGSWGEVPLEKSPYYESYRLGSREIFESYRKILKQFSSDFNEELDWAGFRKLARSLRGGVDPKRMESVRIEGGVIYDGQHRLAILLALHGPGYEL